MYDKTIYVSCHEQGRIAAYDYDPPSNGFIPLRSWGGVAGVGFLTQVLCGFSLPFPLNWIFFPLDIVEWYIRWTITS